MNRFYIAVQSSVRMLCIYLVAGSAFAAMYKWVDEEGTVHYTQSPPPAGIEAETIQPPPEVDSAPALEQLQKNEAKSAEYFKNQQKEAEKQAEVEKKLAMKKKNCEMAKARLDSYVRPRVKFVQEDGTRVRATEEERQAQIKKSEDMIKEFCTE